MKHERLAISTKYNHRRALKGISDALEQMTNYSERYKWRSMSSRIIMQLYEDSISFKNFRSWYFIQTASKARQNDIARIAQLMWRSKNLGSTKTDRSLLKKEGMPSEASPSLDAWVSLNIYLGCLGHPQAWALASLPSSHIETFSIIEHFIHTKLQQKTQ